MVLPTQPLKGPPQRIDAPPPRPFWGSTFEHQWLSDCPFTKVLTSEPLFQPPSAFFHRAHATPPPPLGGAMANP